MRRLGELLLIAFSLAGCGVYDDTFTVQDVTKEQHIVLAKTHSGNTYSYSLRGTGNIQGKATITILVDGKPYRSEELEGRVSFNWGGDWYEDSAQIIYRPSSVTSGTLKLEYAFSTL